MAVKFEPTPDVVVENHFSVFLFHPGSDEARAWIKDNVPGETTWWCGALVVEPRYAQNLERRMTEDGLVVK